MLQKRMVFLVYKARDRVDKDKTRYVLDCQVSVVPGDNGGLAWDSQNEHASPSSPPLAVVSCST